MLPHSDLNLPADLEGLADLALDLRWTVRQTTDKIWELLDAGAWEKTMTLWALRAVPSL